MGRGDTKYATELSANIADFTIVQYSNTATISRPASFGRRIRSGATPPLVGLD